VIRAVKASLALGGVATIATLGSLSPALADGTTPPPPGGASQGGACVNFGGVFVGVGSQGGVSNPDGSDPTTIPGTSISVPGSSNCTPPQSAGS